MSVYIYLYTSVIVSGEPMWSLIQFRSFVGENFSLNIIPLLIYSSVFNHCIKNEKTCLFSCPFGLVIFFVLMWATIFSNAIVWILDCRHISQGIEKVCAVCSFHPVNCKGNSIIYDIFHWNIEHWIVVHIMTWQIYIADNRTHLLQLKEIGNDNSICFTIWYDSQIDADEILATKNE